MSAPKNIAKVPNMKKLSPEVKKETPSKRYSYDPRPCLDITAIDLPQIKEWSVGKGYNLEVKVKMESYNEGIDSDTGKEKIRACLRVTAIGVDADSDKKGE